MKKTVLFFLSFHFYNCITFQVYKYINEEEEKIYVGKDNKIKAIYLNSDENNLMIEHINSKFGKLHSEFVPMNNETINNFSLDLVKKKLNYSVKQMKPSVLIVSPVNNFYLKIPTSYINDKNLLLLIDLEKLEIKKIQFRGGIARFKLKSWDSFFERKVNIFKIVLKNNTETFYCNQGYEISKCEVKTTERFFDLEMNYLNENFFFIYGDNQFIFIEEDLPEKLKSVLKQRNYSFVYPNKPKNFLFYHSKKILYLTFPLTITIDFIQGFFQIMRGFFNW